MKTLAKFLTEALVSKKVSSEKSNVTAFFNLMFAKYKELYDKYPIIANEVKHLRKYPCIYYIPLKGKTVYYIYKDGNQYKFQIKKGKKIQEYTIENISDIHYLDRINLDKNTDAHHIGWVVFPKDNKIQFTDFERGVDVFYKIEGDKLIITDCKL